MLNIKKQIFNAAIASLLIAAPVLAADNATVNGDEGFSGRTIASRKLECSGPGGEHGKKMGFSDSQLEKMSALKNEFLDKTAGERSELGTLHRQLQNVLSQTSIDRAKAEGIQTKINSIKADLSLSRLDLKMDRIAILTPEQREQMHHHMLVAEAFGSRIGHHRHFGGKHFEHGGARQEKS